MGWTQAPAVQAERQLESQPGNVRHDHNLHGRLLSQESRQSDGELQTDPAGERVATFRWDHQLQMWLRHSSGAAQDAQGKAVVPTQQRSVHEGLHYPWELQGPSTRAREVL